MKHLPKIACVLIIASICVLYSGAASDPNRSIRYTTDSDTITATDQSYRVTSEGSKPQATPTAGEPDMTAATSTPPASAFDAESIDNSTTADTARIAAAHPVYPTVPSSVTETPAPTPRYLDDENGITMTVQEKSIPAQAQYITLVFSYISDDKDGRYVFSDVFHLYKYVDGQWVDAPLKNNLLLFEGMADEVSYDKPYSESRNSLRYFAITAGHYKIVKNINGAFDLSAEFDVTA